MTVVANSVSVRAQMGWRLAKSIAGFNDAQQGSEGLSATFGPDTAVYNHVYALAEATIAPAGTLALNFNAFTDLLGTAVTATKVCGVLIKAGAAVTGGILKIEPHGTDGLPWPFGGTTPSVSLTVGTSGAGLLLWQGTAQALSAPDAQWLLTNTGTADITVTASAVVGT